MVDILLVIIYLLLIGVICVTVFSVWRSLKMSDRSQKLQNRIPVVKIAVGCAVLLVVCLALTFVLGSSQPMLINGESYNQTFWLKTADMFIFTAIILCVVAVAGVGFGLSGYNRKIK